MTKPKPTTVLLTPAQVRRLQAAFARLGYVQTRGTGTGSLGSLSAGLRAIANRELEVIKRDKGDNDG